MLSRVWRKYIIASSVKIKNRDIINILAEVTERMLMNFEDRLRRVILFGSYARNEADKESDVDILLLIDDDQKNIKHYHNLIVDIMVELSLKYNLVVSITEQEYKHYLKYVKFVPFYSNVNDEGVEFYAR